MDERRQTVEELTVSNENKALLRRVIGEGVKAVGDARRDIYARSGWVLAGVGASFLFLIFWPGYELFQSFHVDLGSPWWALLGTAVVVVPVSAVGVSAFKLSEMRLGEFSYYTVLAIYIGGISTMLAAEFGFRLKHIGVTASTGMVILALICILALVGFSTGALLVLAPWFWLGRHLRRAYPRQYLSILLLDVVIAEARAQDAPWEVARWEDLRARLQLSADLIQMDLPFALRIGYGALDGKLLLECWRIAEASRNLEIELLPLPRTRHERAFRGRVLEAIASARAGWWGNLPRSPETPSPFDLWVRAFAASLPQLGLLFLAFGFSVYALVGLKQGSAYWEAYGKAVLSAFGTVSGAFTLIQGLKRRQRH